MGSLEMILCNCRHWCPIECGDLTNQSSVMYSNKAVRHAGVVQW